MFALFAIGIIGSLASTYAEAVSDALVVSTPNALSVARGYAAGASVGSYALFAGGASDTVISTTVNAYTTALVRSTLRRWVPRVGARRGCLELPRP